MGFHFGGGLIQKRGILTTHNGIGQLPQSFQKKKLPSEVAAKCPTTPQTEGVRATLHGHDQEVLRLRILQQSKGMKGEKTQYRPEGVIFCE